jgi:ABC-type sugar transport system substrate-binding protein
VKLLRTASVGLAAVVAALASAQAAEWRFCIAPANQDHRIYMTAPFLTSVSMEMMESGFHQALERANRRHDSVQCPTGPGELAVRAMRQHADDFNRQLGTEVVPVDWKPAGVH